MLFIIPIVLFVFLYNMQLFTTIISANLFPFFSEKSFTSQKKYKFSRGRSGRRCIYIYVLNFMEEKFIKIEDDEEIIDD